MKTTTTSVLKQIFIFSAIMLISNGIAYISPVPMPASVIGLTILFVSLSTNLIKLEQVETLGSYLTSIIAFLFVPSGISLINSLDILKVYGWEIMTVIFVATFIILAATGWSATQLLNLKEKANQKEPAVKYAKPAALKEVQN